MEESKVWVATLGDSGYIIQYKVVRGTREDVGRYVALLGKSWRFHEASVIDATNEFVTDYEVKRDNYLSLLEQKRSLEEQIKEAAKEIVH